MDGNAHRETTSFLERFWRTAKYEEVYLREQGVVGRMTNVSLDHRGVDLQLRTVLQAELDRGLNNCVIDNFDRLRSSDD
jgi:hypothetical protein